MIFVDASAKSNHNIREIFTRLADNIIEKKQREEREGGRVAGNRDSVQLARGQVKKSDNSGGCKC